MKRSSFILLCLFIINCSLSIVQAQSRDSTRYSATTAWQNINYGSVFVLTTGYCVNDGTGTEDSIAIGFGTADTAVTVRHKLYYGETFSWTKKSVKKLWYRSLGGTTVPIRLSSQSPSN
jgi:hypothetical protein